MTAFQLAVSAVADGDEPILREFLRSDPALVRERSTFPHRTTLLHYVAANGVEVQRSPRNAGAIARMLLQAGALADATASIYDRPEYATTLCLVVSSIHPYLAAVQTDIVDALLDHGAKAEGIDDDGAPLGMAIMFGYTAAAERLAARGARVDNLICAAGLGRNELVREMLDSGTGSDTIVRRTDDRAGRFSFPIARDADAREVALIAAGMHGRVTTLRILLDRGISVNATPFCNQSALHYAAYMGHREIIDELAARGANFSLVDTQMQKTPAEWAHETGHALP